MYYHRRNKNRDEKKYTGKIITKAVGKCIRVRTFITLWYDRGIDKFKQWNWTVFRKTDLCLTVYFRFSFDLINYIKFHTGLIKWITHTQRHTHTKKF